MTKSQKLTIMNPNFSGNIDPKITLTVQATTDMFPGAMHHPRDLMTIIAQSSYVESVTLEPALEIKVGGTYKNGADQQIKIVSTEEHDNIVHYVGDDGYHYRFDGTFGFDPDERSSADLVTLVFMILSS
jgi:hypothetical protein